MVRPPFPRLSPCRAVAGPAAEDAGDEDPHQCRLYSAVPRWSVCGCAAAAARSAASAMLSAVSGFPVSAAAASVAPMVDPPTPVSAIPARITVSPDVSMATAIPTVAKSPTRRSSFRYPPDLIPLAAGTTASTAISSCSSAFSNGPVTKLGQRDGAPAVRALRDHRAAEREHHRGPVALRVGVAQRPDERAPVPHQRVGDERRRRGHRRLRALEQFRELQVGVPAERADVQAAVGVGPVVVQARAGR